MSEPVVVERHHDPGCNAGADGGRCARCTGFEPGHTLSVKHGAYVSTLRLGPRVDEIAGEIRPLVPGYRPSDEFAVRTLAVVLVRIEKATVALGEVDEMNTSGKELQPYMAANLAAQFARLREDLRGWVNTERRLLNDLGLTPMARAKLGLDVAMTAREETLQHMAARRAAESVVEGNAIEIEAGL